MKIYRPKDQCLAIGTAHREKGKGAAPGLSELLVCEFICVAGTVMLL